jgi:hypothetical protein
MLAWITANLGNIAVTLLLIAIVTAVIIKLIKDKKNGISSCGGNCAHCGMCAACRKADSGK